MKTKLLLAFFCFGFIYSLKAQNPFPIFSDNLQWNVKDETFPQVGPPHNYVYSYIYTNEYRFTQTAQMCGYTYSKTNSNIFIRNEGQKVYARQSQNCNDYEYLIYDFGLQVGDSIKLRLASYYYYDDTLGYKLRADGLVNYQGQDRRALYFDVYYYKFGSNGSSVFFQDTWIEGIGSIIHPFYFEIGVYRPTHTIYSLLCYFENDVQLFQSQHNSCYLTNLGIKENETSYNFSISPNPANDYFRINLENQIEFKNAVFRLSDVSGKLLWEKTFEEIENQNVSIQSLTSGVYILQLFSNEHLINTQKLIKN